LTAQPAASVTPDAAWLDPDGRLLPFRSDGDVLEFLSKAEVIRQKRLSEGINRVHKVLLEHDGVRAHAVFRQVIVQKQQQKGPRGQVILNFRDDCRFEVAAYRLSRILGLKNVPPVLQRKLFGKVGTLQIWVEQTFMEKDRIGKGMKPPDPARHMYQWQIMYLFDHLIHNDDRNQGNILYDSDWNLWMIDHTRAFRPIHQTKSLITLRYCRHDVYRNLKALNAEGLRSEIEGVLGDRQIQALLARRDQIISHVDAEIQKRGEKVVLFQ
jgi:hypothetical protein